MKQLIFGGEPHRLADDTDLQRLRRDIADRLRGDTPDPWLEVPTKSKGSVWILVTQHSEISIIESSPGGPRVFVG